VTNPRVRRSTDVEHTLTMAIDQAPANVTASFEALYRGSADAVYAYAASLLRDRSAAEEVTAAAFERAFRKQRSFDPRRGTQRAWLFGIARNAALDELRRRKRSAELTAEPTGDEPAPEGEAEAAERRATVRAAMAELEPRERDSSP
jgi:RNA polymerase sigma-70 factor, ECF subfamily